MRALRIVNGTTMSPPAPSEIDQARALVSGTGRYERGSAFEPLLVPLVARYAAADEVWFTCYAGSLAARPNPRLGWPLLGIATAREVAPLVDEAIVWDAIQTLPDLALYVRPELLAPIADRRAHERISRRVGMRRGEPPVVDVIRALQQPWDASGLVLHFESTDVATRQRDAATIVSEMAGAERMRQLLYLALAAPYALDRRAVAHATLDLLDADVPGWYWCTLAAHLGAGWPGAGARARQCIPPVWAEHFERLAAGADGIDPVTLPAAAHPFGHELLALIAQMGPDDRRTLAREVLNGVVDRWAIDVTLDDVPALFPAQPEPAPVVDAPAANVPLGFPPPTTPAVTPLPPPRLAASPLLVAERPAAPALVEPALVEPALVEPAPGGPAPADEIATDVPADGEMSVHVAVRGIDGQPLGVTRSFVVGADHQLLLSVPAGSHGETTSALTITLLHDGDRLTRTLPARIVPAGSSTVVPFSLYVRPDEQFVVATLTVHRGDEVVSESVLIGDTGSDPDAVAGGSIRLRRR